MPDEPQQSLPAVGQSAPTFTLPDQHGEPVSLELLRGRWVVLYFYPKDDTPGCTTEAVQFNALLDRFASLEAQVLGVSPDGSATHRRFATKHELRLRLLADPEHGVIERYGAWRLKKMYGKESWGVVRSTVLIDPAGVVREAWAKVDADGHAGAVCDRLAALRG